MNKITNQHQINPIQLAQINIYIGNYGIDGGCLRLRSYENNISTAHLYHNGIETPLSLTPDEIHQLRGLGWGYIRVNDGGWQSMGDTEKILTINDIKQIESISKLLENKL
jgi:hypothetical protein